MAHRLTAATSVVLILLLGWSAWTRLSPVSDGTVVQVSNAVWQQQRIPVGLQLCACNDLRAGDEVVAVTGPPGGPYVYAVVHDGVRRDVAVQEGTVSWATLARLLWSPLLTVVLLLLVGWFVFAHRPADPAARTLLLAASLFGFGTTTWLLGDTALRLATGGPRLSTVLGETALALAWGAAAHFAVVMPGSALRVRTGMIATLYALPFALHGLYLAVVLPRAEGRLEVLGRLAQVSLVPSVVMPAVAACLMLLGYLTTRDLTARRRLRWVLISFLASAVLLLSLWAVPMLSGDPVLQVTLLPTALLPPVIALAAAILRYRLFDIEIILRRSLVYGALTACVLAIYLSAGLVFGHLVGAGQGLAAVLATCLVAFAVQPIRDWLQARVGGLIYGERDNPYSLVTRLSRVDVAVEPQDALAEVARSLARALRLAHVEIELYTGTGRTAVRASWGTPSGPPRTIPLRRGLVPVGLLLLDVGPAQEPFGPADRRLLDALTRHIGNIAAVVLLNADLRESRHRLVLAREEERRRIAHALRHGLEAALVTHIADLRKARALIATDPARAAALLDDTIVSTRTLVRDIRALVADMRPPALDQLGLVDAIRERVRRLREDSGTATPDFDVVTENGLGPLPAAVEVAAFWITVEAARHARCESPASRSRAVLARRGDLYVEVRNNDGFDTGPRLTDATRWAGELGGTTTTTATAVRARLPIREGTYSDGD
ncbi:sensor histidine kinase [Actinoplanes sp. GCM10030250]|uniref:sensor histidine kinase n=1 Tax=Actinoplanes sp. GCM10030250 TaxID=3273376 RepID=UPI00361B3488